MKPGDAVEAITSAVGIKPCGRCNETKALMNSKRPTDVLRGLAQIPGNAARMLLRPEQTAPDASRWTVPPLAPAGWELVDSCEDALLFKNELLRQVMVWRVENGRYHRSLKLVGPVITEDAVREAFEAKCK